MRRIRVLIRQNSLAVLFLVGVVFVLVGLVFAIWPNPHPNIATVLISVGGSLIAASFATYLSPITEDVYQRFLGLGISEAYPSRKEVPNHQWCNWLRSARQRCVLIGIAHNEWCRDPDFEPALKEALRKSKKLEVRIYFLDPTSEIAKIRAKEDTARDTIATIRKSIEVMWNLRGRLPGEECARFRLYVYGTTPAGTTWIDSLMIVTHYLAGYPNLTSPALVIQPVGSKTGQRDLYAVYSENVEAVASHAVEINDANIGAYVPREAS